MAYVGAMLTTLLSHAGTKEGTSILQDKCCTNRLAGLTGMLCSFV